MRAVVPAEWTVVLLGNARPYFRLFLCIIKKIPMINIGKPMNG
jgi:hypothetical protein